MCINSKNSKMQTTDESVKLIYYQIYNVIDGYVKEYNDDLVISDDFKIYLTQDHDKYIEVEKKFNVKNNSLDFRITTPIEVYTYSINMNKINDTILSGSFRSWFRDILLNSLFDTL